MPDANHTQNLKGRLRGQLLDRQAPGFDESRKVWNGMFDRRPEWIARCAGAADVRNSVLFAREHGIPVAVKGGGHSVAGNSSLEGGLLIDLGPMKGIRVDPARRTVSAQTGVTWGEFDRETTAFELATTGGVISSTGIAGLTLGGGIGWLMGKYGLVCDNLVSADVVTADGRLLTANANQNQDLLWALRGGGGNFGIATSLEYQLYPMSMVTAGMLLHPFERAPGLFRLFREAIATAPDDLTTYAAVLTSPDGRLMCGLALCHSGDLKQAEQDLQPLRTFGPPVADMVGPMPYTALQTMLDATAPYGIRSYWKAQFMSELTEEALNTLLAFAERKPSPQTLVILEHVHGAASRVPADQTAYGVRADHCSLNIITSWTDPREDEKCVAWTREFAEAMAPFGDGSVYVNYLGNEGDARVRSAYGGNYDRLAELKTKYDPTNFFKLNQNIRPLSSGGTTS
jgi:hypothetical protein